MRYFVRFAYNGTSFHGSQTQPNGITVQETLEQAFSTILRQPIALTFAGRTDAGVHALEMFAHFDLPSPSRFLAPSPSRPIIPPTSERSLLPTTYYLLPKLNSLLPPAIAVYDVFQVEDSTHARFSALARTYYYKVTEQKDPFNLHLLTQVSPGLDYDLMNEAAQLLLGTHDFASFCKVHTDVNNTICTITHAEWQPCIVHCALCTNYLFAITANRFLRNMVRAIVGTLFEVGRHKMSLAEFQSVIDAKNRCLAGQSVSPDGLYLAHIEYPFKSLDPLDILEPPRNT